MPRFKVGDKVRPKTREECRAEGYKVTGYGDVIDMPFGYVRSMIDAYKDRVFIIDCIEEDTGRVFFKKHPGFSWHKDMLKLVITRTPAGNSLEFLHV